MSFTILAICLLIGAFVDGRPQTPIGLQRPPLIPPGFQEHLPEDAKQKLIDLHFNKDLTFEQRKDGIEGVLDELPKEVLEKLPLPPGLERLPEESKAKFKELHMNRELDWKERQKLVQEAIKELPEHEQKMVEPPRQPMPFMGQGFQQGFPQGMGPPPMGQPMPPFMGPMGFPPHPPPGFEAALAPTIYRQLMAVHSNPQLSVSEKKQHIDRIMANVPQEQLDRLPLPPLFDRLSMENQQRLRQKMHNFQLDWDSRHEAVKEFIKQLPLEQRRKIRPSPPPGFEQIPEETMDQVDALFMDDKLSPPERLGKIYELIQKLPAEIRAKLPPFMPQQPTQTQTQQQ